MHAHSLAQTSELATQFLAEILDLTSDCPTDDAYRAIIQTFLDALFPWIDFADLPHPPATSFTLMNTLCLRDDDTILSAFSPEGRALFRAWLRRRGVDPRRCRMQCVRDEDVVLE
jgi:hypothetical protein